MVGTSVTHPSLIMPIQFGFQLETKFYMEDNMTQKPDQPVLYYEFTSGEQTECIHVVPDGCVDVLFYCDAVQPHAEICGSVLAAKVMRFQPGARYFGVRFLPGHGIGVIPLKDWIEQRVTLQDVFALPDEYMQRIFEAQDFHERVQWFAALFLPLMTTEQLPELVQYCLDEITGYRGNITVNDLSVHTGYSTRYLRKKFEDCVGFSPKLFAQTVRFQHALHMIMKNDVDLLDIVHEQGYYDHSHFVNNFKKFSHLSPHQLRLEWSQRKLVTELELL
ncbi:helix-turn-helix domain-containing protein [Paenibacillus sp. WLX1005]|uniref:helix-turn-helix domain-containing protein n=1 Tax=Paenibacillus sp. WLX1005 TaxID=3243766 RepID=UPI003984069B